MLMLDYNFFTSTCYLLCDNWKKKLVLGNLVFDGIKAQNFIVLTCGEKK